MAQVSAEQLRSAFLSAKDNNESFAQKAQQARKDLMSAMQLAMLRNQYGDIVNAAQSYSSNPDSLSARNTFFQALRANDATKAGANTMLSNRGSAGDVINGALGATGNTGLGNLFSLLAEEQDRNNRGVDLSGYTDKGMGIMTIMGGQQSGNSGQGENKNVYGSSGAPNLIPGLMGSADNSNAGGSLRTLKKV